MKNGIDNLKAHVGVLTGKRLGLIVNQAAANRELKSTLDVMVENFDVTALFGPEHGVMGNLQHGEKVVNGKNFHYDIPEYNFYGRDSCFAEHLDEVDVIVFELQDIGSRPFTFMYNLADAMEICGQKGIPLVVLDRMNPLGGAMEGIVGIEKGTFGYYPIPWRHGITMGEFARMVNDRYQFGCELTVIPCSDWRREMFFSDTGLHWIWPTPNVPSETTALLYAGFCAIGQTNVSEGRGTTLPYQVYGAPYIDPYKLAKAMDKHRFPGVICRPCCFTPTFNMFKKYIGENCYGVQIHITDKRQVNAFELGMWFMHEVRENFSEFSTHGCFNDVLGSDRWANGTESTEELLRRGQKECREFAAYIRQYLLY